MFHVEHSDSRKQENIRFQESEKVLNEIYNEIAALQGKTTQRA